MKARTYLRLLLSVCALSPVLNIAPAYALNYENYPVVKLRSLDKITARTMTFEAKVGTTVRFGEIFIKVQSCRKPPPVEKSEAAAFLQIWQTNETSNESKWIFSGWMFASSPALSAMDHPVYDVWVLDCLGRDPEPLPAPDPDVGVKTPETDGVVPDAVPPPVEPDTQKQPATDADVTPQDDPGAFDDTSPAPEDSVPEESVPASNMPAEANPTYAPAPDATEEYQDETPADDSAPIDDTMTPAQQQPVTPVAPNPAPVETPPAKQEFEGIY